MNTDQHNGGWIILVSFLAALMLMAMPLPEWAVNWRPAWLTMVLIYWCMALPSRVGIGAAWFLGMLLDVQQGAVLGQNALSMAIIAYVMLNFYQRIRMFPLVQQALLVCGLLLLQQFLALWIRGMMGHPPAHWSFWMPALTSMILWPWLFIVLRDLRRKFRVF